MTKTVSNRAICFIKAMLSLCKHGHLFSTKNRKWCFYRYYVVYNLDENYTNFMNILCLHAWFNGIRIVITLTNIYFVRAPQTKCLFGIVPVAIEPTGRSQKT